LWSKPERKGFLEAWGMNSLICFCTVRVYFLLQFCSPTAYTQNWQYVPGLAKKDNPSLWLQKTFRHTDRFRKGNNSLIVVSCDISGNLWHFARNNSLGPWITKPFPEPKARDTGPWVRDYFLVHLFWTFAPYCKYLSHLLRAPDEESRRQWSHDLKDHLFCRTCGDFLAVGDKQIFHVLH
jgi:hypothetical protein